MELNIIRIQKRPPFLKRGRNKKKRKSRRAFRTVCFTPCYAANVNRKATAVCVWFDMLHVFRVGACAVAAKGILDAVCLSFAFSVFSTII